ncbi:glycosyltransferase family 39 protein [Actinosynnema pretiosum]|uniref:Glycosyltransferase RgtA/B/C/D-like domain-containing protein n=1 Tax=Actinosynnema pretiosum TaxID=42197 RepID=A0A290ZAL6_9PSEU|nr:glycosyltransferase family 39 protein [Actinosynnema pretiosum]ATE56035.1 hypothetical protein CNX65_24455 [Actinosynnema pretiosum]
MTTTTRTTPTSGGPPGARWAVGWPVALLGLFVVALGLRLYNAASAHELFIDESEYTDIARSIGEGRGVRLFGEPFHLHPPLLFGLLSLFADPAAPLLQAVLDLRWVNAVLGGASAVVVALLADRARGRAAGVLAGALFALNPYLVKFDSRVTLETLMGLGVLLGVLLLAVAGARGAWALAAGAAFGLALVSKETSALVTTVPLLLFLVLRRPVPRRSALLALGGQAAVYAVYVAGIAATGHLPGWWGEKSSGVLRAVGVVQSTGYNAPGRSSLGERLIANSGLFAPAYLVIAFGVVAACALLALRWRELADGPLAVVLHWQVAVCPPMAYTVLFGTLEEQTFYLVAVPATAATAVVLAGWLADAGRVRLVAAGIAAVLLVWSAAAWSVVHTTRDDGYARFQAWADRELPANSRLAVGEHTGKFVLTGFRVKEVRTARAAFEWGGYALVSTALAERGLGSMPQSEVDELARGARLVHVERGRTLGELRLYELGGGRR